jgi:hypothetical protein
MPATVKVTLRHAGRDLVCERPELYGRKLPTKIHVPVVGDVVVAWGGLKVRLPITILEYRLQKVTDSDYRGATAAVYAT